LTNPKLDWNLNGPTWNSGCNFLTTLFVLNRQSNWCFSKLLLTSIFPLEDISKIPQKKFIFKRWILADCEKAFKALSFGEKIGGKLCNIFQCQNKCQQEL
jgi:hypothetical protein